MIVQKRTLGWLPRPSLFNEAKAAAAKRRSAAQSFIANQNATSSAFGGIQTSLTQGMVSITSQIAAARLGIHLRKSA
jgi:hypothetical protein